MLLETRGDVAIAWLNRPPANPLSPQAIRELISVWEEVEGEVRAFVIASSNIFTFCAGADIKEFTKMSPDAEGAELVEAAHRFMRGMETSSTVTIAAVNSIAFGGGCELAMACDFRIAAESATFGQPEINLGIIPGFGGTQRLPRLVGEAKALEMNLSGDPIDAWEAHRVGLANQVVPDHELFDTTMAWAHKLAEKAPIAVEEIKTRSRSAGPGRGPRLGGRGLRAGLRLRRRKGGLRSLPGQAPADVPGPLAKGAGLGGGACLKAPVRSGSRSRLHRSAPLGTEPNRSLPMGSVSRICPETSCRVDGSTNTERSRSKGKIGPT